MTKIKTKKSAAKRFKITGTGKLLRGRSFTRHLRVKKSRRQKRRLKGEVEITGTYAKKLKKRLGVKK